MAHATSPYSWESSHGCLSRISSTLMATVVLEASWVSPLLPGREDLEVVKVWFTVSSEDLWWATKSFPGPIRCRQVLRATGYKMRAVLLFSHFQLSLL